MCNSTFYYNYLNCIICVTALSAQEQQGSKDLGLSNKTSKADGERDMKEIKLNLWRCWGVYVRENWVSSLVRHMLAEPAPLSHLQVSPRQQRGSVGAAAVTNGREFLCGSPVPTTPALSDLAFRTEVVQQTASIR